MATQNDILRRRRRDGGSGISDTPSESDGMSNVCNVFLPSIIRPSRRKGGGN